MEQQGEERVAVEETRTVLPTTMKNTRISITRKIPVTASRSGESFYNSNDEASPKQRQMVNPSDAQRASCNSSVFCGVQVSRTETATDSFSFENDSISTYSGSEGERDSQGGTSSVSYYYSNSPKNSQRQRLGICTLMDREEVESEEIQPNTPSDIGNSFLCFSACTRAPKPLPSKPRRGSGFAISKDAISLSRDAIVESRSDDTVENNNNNNNTYNPPKTACSCACQQQGVCQQVDFENEVYHDAMPDHEEYDGMNDDDSSIQISHRCYQSRSETSSKSSRDKLMMPSLLTASSEKSAKLDPNKGKNPRAQHPIEIAFINTRDDAEKGSGVEVTEARASEGKDVVDHLEENTCSVESASIADDEEEEDDHQIVEAEETVLLKGLGCMGLNGAMTIPMAESDVYSLKMLASVDIQLDKPTEDDGETDNCTANSSDMQLYNKQCSSDLSDATGPQPIESASTTSSDTSPRFQSRQTPDTAADDDDLVEFYDTGFSSSQFTGMLSSIEEESYYDSASLASSLAGSIDYHPSYSIDNGKMSLPGHLQFCNVVADAMAGGASVTTASSTAPSVEALDLGGDQVGQSTDAFEEDIATELMQSFTGFERPISASQESSTNDATDGMSQCIGNGDVGPGALDVDNDEESVAENEVGGNKCGDEHEDKPASAPEDHKGSNISQLDHESTRPKQEIGTPLTASNIESASTTDDATKSQATIDHTIVLAGEILNQHQDSILQQTLEERKRAVQALMFLTKKRDETVKARLVYDGSKTRDWIDREEAASPTASLESIMQTKSPVESPLTGQVISASANLQTSCFPPQPHQTAKERQPNDMPLERDQQQNPYDAAPTPLPPQSTREGSPIKSFSSQPPASATSTTPRQLQANQFPITTPVFDTNKSAPLHPLPKTFVDVPINVSYSNLSMKRVIVRICPSRQPGSMSDTIILRGSQEQSGDTEAALMQTYQNLTTPLHSNRTGTNGFDPSSSLKHAADSDSQEAASSSCTSLFRTFGCHEGSDNHNIPSNTVAEQDQENNAAGTSAQVEPTVNIANMEDSEENEAACINLCANVDTAQSDDISKIDTGVHSMTIQNDFTASQDITVRASNRGARRPSLRLSSDTSIETITESCSGEEDDQLIQKDTNVSGGSGDGKDNSTKELPHPRSTRSSEEVGISVGKVLHSIFSDSNEEGAAANLDSAPSYASKIASKRSARGSSFGNKSYEEVPSVVEPNMIAKGSSADRFPEAIPSNTDQDTRALIDQPRAEEAIAATCGDGSSEQETSAEEEAAGSCAYRSCEQEPDGKHHVGESVIIAEKTIFLASPKAKAIRTKRPDKDVSTSVEHVLSGLFSASTLDESFVENLSSDTFLTSERTEEADDQFLTDMTNNFFDLFNVSSSTTMVTASESCEMDTSTTCTGSDSIRTDNTSQVLENVSEDESAMDDATLNPLDFEKFSIHKRCNQTGPHDSMKNISGVAPHALNAEASKAILVVDEESRDPSNETDDKEENERDRPEASCTAIVPYIARPLYTVGAPNFNVESLYTLVAPNFNVELPPKSNSKTYIAFPLYPTLGRFRLHKYRSTLDLLGVPPALDKLLLSHTTIKPSLLQQTDVDQSIIPVQVSKKPDTPKGHLSIQTEAMQSAHSTEDDLIAAAAGNRTPCTPRSSITGTPFSPNRVTPTSNENPDWSFLDLEKSIDESLDTFINSLLSPVEETSSEEVSVNEEKALEQLLSAERCEGSAGIKLHLDPSTSSVENECSSTFSAGSGTRILKSAGAMLSDGDSTAPTDSSMDEQSEFAKKDGLDYLDGMTLGLAGLLGEEEIARLDDSQVDLPQIFEKEHFGSISEMVQEIHLMRSIQMEQKMFEPQEEDEVVDFEEDMDEAENDKMQEMLIEQSLQIERQKSKIEALQKELEAEIENVHDGINAMHRERSTEEDWLDKAESSDEDIPGWRDKFAKLRSPDRYSIPITPIFDENVTFEEFQHPDTVGSEGIEINWVDGAERRLRGSANGVSLARTTTQDSDDIDGLDTELKALVDLEEELRLEMESVDESFSSTSSKGARKDTASISSNLLFSTAKGAAEVQSALSLSATKSQDPYGGRTSSAGASSTYGTPRTVDEHEVKFTDVPLGQIGAQSWLSQKSGMIDSCCQYSTASPIKEKKIVTFASQNEEFYFTTDDDDDNYFEDNDARASEEATSSKSVFCDFKVVSDVFVELGYTFGFRSRPEALVGNETTTN